ncbi:hypothetical protein KRR39_09840 [Nocardioides panacis]|uniref:Uncharacterized protein n=1 Tax=Nocardioides panacis TaxID=2849501 RepID=A0A975Y1Y4_9ACTN|nr:hypothetical protein [Nocardioides panacis]QWZ09997.1 hypothetical protein KRR39_09840 [Nocardioides panacis]
MTHETAATTAPALPEQRVGDQEHAPAAPPSPRTASGQPVPFEQLLAVATLTPGQALLVAARLLRAGAAAGTAAAGSAVGCRLGPVSFTPTGDLDVAVTSAEEEKPVTELLRQLLQNARRLPAHPKPEQHLLLHLLEEATAPAPDPDARADGLEEALTATSGSGARQRLSAQLAALVQAATRVVPPVPAPAEDGPSQAGVRPTTRRTRTQGVAPAATDPSRPAPRRAVPATAGASRTARRAHLSSHTRRRRVALVVAVLVAALAASAYVGLLQRGAGMVASVGRDDQPSAPATHAPARHTPKPAQPARAHRSRAVPTLAARHAGPVAGVLVQKSGSCRPGSPCPVKVTVHLGTGSTGQPVRWRVGASRACHGGMAWSAPTTVTPQPGWRTVFASSSVRVPRGSLALVALTTAPARVQSAPVRLPGSAPHC